MFEVRNLCVKRGTTPIVQHLSLSIEAGSIVGLVGPNGAGKTTTICAILGLLEATSDELTLNGQDLRMRGGERRQQFGYVPQSVAIYPELTVRTNLEIWAGLYNLDKQKARTRVEYALQLAGLEHRAQSRVSTLSGGMERRLNLSIGLLHDPDVLICDEPTTGVDAESRKAIYNALLQLKEEGKHILYTTHYFQEVEQLCDRVVIIQDGKALVESSVEALLRRGTGNDSSQKLQVETALSASELEASLKAANIEVNAVRPDPVSLESVYLRLTAKSSEGGSE